MSVPASGAGLLYVLDMAPAPTLRAWRPPVDGIAEVLHAAFPEHAYPLHTHDTWTLLLVDAGAVRYDLERHEHGALTDRVTLLPPHVPHNGTHETAAGFRKRVLYVEPAVLGPALIGHAVDHPGWRDDHLRGLVDGVHRALVHPGDELAAEGRLAVVTDLLRARLTGTEDRTPAHDSPLAHRLRELLDAHVVEGVTLTAAAAQLGTHPSHLVRSFGREFGIAPHRYLTGRRLDRARRLLLSGLRPADVAVAVGFHDESHLARHFRAMLGTTPGRYASSAA
jgi:AraC-like DNA-binding protein